MSSALILCLPATLSAYVLSKLYRKLKRGRPRLHTIDSWVVWTFYSLWWLMAWSGCHPSVNLPWRIWTKMMSFLWLKYPHLRVGRMDIILIHMQWRQEGLLVPADTMDIIRCIWPVIDHLTLALHLMELLLQQRMTTGHPEPGRHTSIRGRRPITLVLHNFGHWENGPMAAKSNRKWLNKMIWQRGNFWKDGETKKQKQGCTEEETIDL